MMLQFSAEQLPTLQEQLERQEEKVRAAAPKPAQVKALTKSVAKAQISMNKKLCVQFLVTFSPVPFYKTESWRDEHCLLYMYKHYADTLSAQWFSC
jgi:hypothetical protein